MQIFLALELPHAGSNFVKFHLNPYQAQYWDS